MVNKCVVHGCKSGYSSVAGKVSTFTLPFDKPNLLIGWIKFVNRANWEPTKNSVICIKHFEDRFVFPGNGKRKKLKWRLGPIPTIHFKAALEKPSTLPTPTPSTSSPTSPSFLDAFTSSPPTSLFGVDKSQIVRSATQGWPTTLRLGSVVTSDNKLGRFDKAKPEAAENPEPFKSGNIPFEVMTSQCVSTTTTDAETKSPTEEAPTDRATPSPSVSSTTPLETPLQDTSNTVSSTTSNPPSCSKSSVNHSSTSQSAFIGVTSTISTTPPITRKRSRNPKRWSIDDVIAYVRETEPALHSHLFIFQKHEIDGRAFLLLNSSNIVKYMGLKLGPALKLCSLVESVKASIEKYVSKRKPTKE